MGPPDYVLGSDDAKIARLQVQAAALVEPTALLLKRAGIVAGMRVLDIGTRPGDVAFQLAELVRVLEPAIVASGVATEEDLGLDTLEQQVVDAIDDAGTVWTTPTVVGCWGRRA